MQHKGSVQEPTYRERNSGLLIASAWDREGSYGENLSWVDRLPTVAYRCGVEPRGRPRERAGTDFPNAKRDSATRRPCALLRLRKMEKGATLPVGIWRPKSLPRCKRWVGIGATEHCGNCQSTGDEIRGRFGAVDMQQKIVKAWCVRQREVCGRIVLLSRWASRSRRRAARRGLKLHGTRHLLGG